MRYPIEVFGGCLEEWLPDGSQVIADTEAEIRPLSLVSIVIGRTGGPWSRWMDTTGEESRGAVKLFLGHLRAKEGDAILVGQINPPVISLIPLAEIEALHAVVACEGGAKLTEADREAFDLIAPFGRGEGMQPINPAWQVAA